MPVVVKQNTVEHLYEYQFQRAADLSVLDSVASTIHQRLHIFRTHHHKCAARRQNALGYELRQESQRTEWLRRKYLDSVRQQPPGISSVINTRMDSTAGSSNRVSRDLEVTESNLDCGPVDLKPNINQVHPITTTTESPPPLMNGGVSRDRREGTPNKTLEMVRIKREPADEATTPPPSLPPPPPPSLPPPPCRTKNESRGNSTSSELKRRMTLTLKPENSKWKLLNDVEEDGKDELKLTAYDVIAGVISTPLLKPLETDMMIDNTYASGKSSSLKGTVNRGHCPTTPTATPTVPPLSISTPSSTISKSSKDHHSHHHHHHHSLDQALDEFSKVMHQVTQEQIAKERKQSFVSELEGTLTTPTSSFSPYHLSIPQSSHLPLELTAQNHFYPRLQQAGHHSQPTQVAAERAFKAPGNGMETKLTLGSPCLLTSNTNSDCSTATPTTSVETPPTTPLEHYSTFPSPPPPHMPHPSNQPSSYSSPSTPVVPMRYSYGNNSTTASMSERWPPPPPQVTRHASSSSQGNLKETIMARVSSRIVTVAGQKRPISDTTLLPPSKIKGSSSLHQQYPISTSMGHLYKAPPLTFPHQP